MEGEYVFVVWKGESERNRFPIGTDTITNSPVHLRISFLPVSERSFQIVDDSDRLNLAHAAAAPGPGRCRR